MKFRRKASATPDPAPDEAMPEAPSEDGAEETSAAPPGPRDSADVTDDGVERLDLGGLRIPAMEGREVRLQVDEASGNVQAVLIVGEDGAMELRAFAAPRNGDLWSKAIGELAAEAAQRGGTADRRQGRYGEELLMQVPVQTPDGRPAVQPSRVVGVNGSRWMLRATYLGRPAVQPDEASDWDEVLTQVVVHRGGQAMPVGDSLPMRLPQGAPPQP